MPKFLYLQQIDDAQVINNIDGSIKNKNLQRKLSLENHPKASLALMQACNLSIKQENRYKPPKK
jgi:hypothetical protein